MTKHILQTERLRLREFETKDRDTLAKTLKDPAVMYAYEHNFDDADVLEWLEEQLARYAKYGYGSWVVELRETGEAIGQCGLSWQDADGRAVLEVGYLFQKEFWHNGYATEAAVACKNYAFQTLGATEVFSIIKWDNIASQNVAKRNGMEERGRFIKHYKGKDMPHIIFSVKREEDKTR